MLPIYILYLIRAVLVTEKAVIAVIAVIAYR